MTFYTSLERLAKTAKEGGFQQVSADVDVVLRLCERERAAERKPDPGQQWKCGDEFLPFHPQASHIEPAYRDGWNRCYWMAVNRAALGTQPVKETQ